MSKKHVSRIGENVKSLTDVAELGPNTLTLCLHNNLLRSLAPLSSFTKIVDLNVSLNQIASTQGLSDLSRLTSLNLSSNLLQQCNNLNGLSSLKSLQLQYNQISGLATLGNLPKYATNLAYLDLRGNSFSLANERQALQRLSALATLILDEPSARQEAWATVISNQDGAYVSLTMSKSPVRSARRREMDRKEHPFSRMPL